MEKTKMKDDTEPATADETTENKRPEKPKEKLYKVRMSKVGDKMQFLELTHVDPETHIPLPQPVLKDIVQTDKYRPDFERRAREQKKFNLRSLGVVFMRKTETFNRKGEKVRVALRHGDAERWDENDIIHNAVEEYDVPESVMPQLAEPFRLGQLVVDGVETRGDHPVRPEKPGAAKMRSYKP